MGRGSPSRTSGGEERAGVQFRPNYAVVLTTIASAPELDADHGLSSRRPSLLKCVAPARSIFPRIPFPGIR